MLTAEERAAAIAAAERYPPDHGYEWLVLPDKTGAPWDDVIGASEHLVKHPNDARYG